MEWLRQASSALADIPQSVTDYVNPWIAPADDSAPLEEKTTASSNRTLILWLCLGLGVIIFLTSLFVWFLIPKGEPCYSSFPADRSYPFVRGKDSRHDLEIIRYFCNDKPEAPVFETWECDDDWKLVSQDNCECYESPPAPSPPNVYDWNKKNLKIGAKVSYYCLPFDKNVLPRKDNRPFEIIQCTNNKTWNVLRKNDFCDNVTALCPNEPPETINGTIREWNRAWYRVGTLIPYYCSGRREKVQRIVACDVHIQWTEIFSQNCDCESDPPEPTTGIYREWDGSRNVGSVAIYLCAPNLNASVLLSYLCEGPQWKLVYRGRCADSNYCSSVPPMPLNQGFVRGSGTIQQKGSMLVYTCDKDSMRVYRTVVCNNLKKWEVVYQSSCVTECSEDALPQNATHISRFSVGRNSSQLGSNRIDFCTRNNNSENMITFQRSFVCTYGVWKKVTEKSCSRILPFKECAESAPDGPEGSVLHWPTRSRYLGAKIRYLCVRNELSVVTAIYVCSDWGKWIQTQSAPCECNRRPPLPSSILYRVVKPAVYSIGTRITVYCTHDRNSPVFWIVTCTPQLKWEIYELSMCSCPPPPPDEYPVTNTMIYKSSMFHLGAKVKYTCTPKPNAEVTLILECKSLPTNTDGKSNGTQWENVFYKDCPTTPHACENTPTAPPKFVEWDRPIDQIFFVGTTVSYFCRGDRSRVWMTSLCTSKGFWKETHTPESCGCLLDPPLAPPGVLRLWDENTMFGSVAYYMCKMTADSRILRTLICDANGTWVQAFRGSCRPNDYSSCKYRKFPSESIMWRNSNISGATVTIKCPQKVAIKIPKVHKVYVCEAFFRSWKLVASADCPCDEPPVVAPNIPYSTRLMMRWNGFRTSGSLVKYICMPTHANTDVPRLILQCSGSNWTKIHRGACGCFGIPPSPHSFSTRVWDKTHYVGSNITFKCSDDRDSPVEQSYTCRGNGRWIPAAPKPKNCECKFPIEPRHPVTWDWDGKTLHMGQIILYRCNNDPHSPQIAAIKCTSHLKWTVLSSYNWTEELARFQDRVNYVHYHVISGIDPIPPKAGRIDLGKMSSVCKGAIVAGMDFNPDWKKLMECRCKCLDEPPSYEPPVFHDWKKNSDYANYYGTVIIYWCSPNTEVYMSVRCAEDGLWRPVEKKARNSCKCSEDPPDTHKYQDYPIERDWPQLSHHVSTKVSHRCAAVENAPIVLQYECVYRHETKRNEWVETLDTGTSVCLCTGDLPIPPERTPPLKIVPQWTYGADEDELVFWIGSMYDYRCSADILSGVFQVVECGADGIWQITDFVGECKECESDPPTGPGVRNWDGSRLIGTVVPYQCTDDVTSLHLMDYQCSREKRVWEQIYNGSCDCKGFPETAPHPLKLQVDWLSPASRYMGVAHKVTCVADEESPVVDTIMCSADGRWIRNSTAKWIKLLKEICICPPAPRMIPFFDPPMPRSNYFIGDTIVYRCAVESWSSVRKILQCSNHRVWIELLDNHLACTCLGNPPPAEGKEFRDWSGSREFGTQIFYRCRMHSPFISKTAKCTSDGEWTVIYTEEAACSCVENEPVLPAGTDETDVRFNHDVGAQGMQAIAQYHCNAYNSSPIFAEISCGSDGQWEVNKPVNLIGNAIDDAFWNRTFKDACFCKDEVGLPTYDPSLAVEIVEPSQRVMGSEIVYLCNPHDHSRYIRKFECTYEKKWEEVEIPDVNKCVCKEDPPPPPKYTDVVEKWKGSRHYGTEVIYYCDKREKTIFQIVQCGVNATWVYTMPPHPFGSCDCPEPPGEIPLKRREWNGKFTTGTIVTFFCSTNSKDNVLYNRAYLAYECSNMRQWKKTMDLNCTCPGKLPSIKTSLSVLFDHDHTLNSSVGAVVHARCSPVKHSPVVVAFTCGHNVTWELTPDITNVIKETCECPVNIPSVLPLKPSHHRVWNGSYKIGTEIYYHCTTVDSPVYEMYSCSLNRTWVKNNTLDDIYLYQIHCHCSAPPVVPVGINVTRPSDISYTVGSKFADRCTPETHSAVFMEYECTVNRTWKITQLSNCNCEVLPTMFPKYVYADWANPSPVDGLLIFSCSSAGGFLASFVCSHTLQWKLTRSVISDASKINDYVNNTCVCTIPVPPVDKPFVIEYDHTKPKWRSGDKVPIRCSLNSTKHVSWYECTTETWIVGKPLDPLLCICSKEHAPKPSAPFYTIDDKDVAVGSDLIYYCFREPPLIFKMVLHCSDSKTWIVKLNEQNCTCKRNSLTDLPDEFVLDKSKDEYPIGKPVTIFCSGFVHPFPVQRMWCTQEGVWIPESDFSWDQLLIDYCECPDPPEPPPGVLIKPENYTQKLGSVISHQCSTNLQDGFDNIFTCEEDEDEKKPTWTTTNNGSCECFGPPEGSETNDWDKEQYKVGTVVNFFCRESVDTPVKYTLTCKRRHPESELEWVKGEEHICECKGKPIVPPTENFFLYYPEGNLVGSLVKMTCSSDPISAPARLFRCAPTGKWVVDESDRSIDGELCMCPPFVNPHPDLSLKYISDDARERRFVGSDIYVLCTEGHEPFLEKHHCSVNRTWEKVQDGICECPSLPVLPSPQKILINIKSKNPLYIGQSHPMVCNDKNPTQIHNHIICAANKSWIYEHSHLCYCSTPPPSPTTDRLYLQWDRQQLIGTIANYTCMKLRSSPIVISVTCSIGDKWIVSPNTDYQDELAEEECTCFADPPQALTHLSRVWTSEQIYMGDEARYECSTGSIDYVYRCNTNRQWERIHMGFCECKTDLPVLTPATAIVTSRYRGAVVHFLCTADPANGLYRDYRCSEDDRWELVREYSCSCELPAPAAPSHFYSYSINVIGSGTGLMYVGSEARYFCSNLSDSAMIRVARCISLSPRDPKIWQYDDKNTTSWTVLKKKCECKVDPPEPYLEAGWDWNGHKRHEGDVVNYYCSDNATTELVIANAKCNVKHQWEIDTEKEWHELLREKCICDEPPKLSLSGASWSWDSPIHYRIGSVVTHWCNKNHTDYHVRYQCNKNKDWQVLEVGNCDHEFCALRHAGGVACIHFSFNPQMFRDAKLTCKLQGKGIVHIRNSEANAKLVQCAYPAPALCKNFYFGVNYSNRTGGWVETRSERPVTGFTNWTRKRRAHEHCATIDSRGRWHPVNCASSHCVLCESPAEDNLYFNCRKASERTPDV